MKDFWFCSNMETIDNKLDQYCIISVNDRSDKGLYDIEKWSGSSKNVVI
jgi:hypothetical protein